MAKFYDALTFDNQVFGYGIHFDTVSRSAAILGPPLLNNIILPWGVINTDTHGYMLIGSILDHAQLYKYDTSLASPALTTVLGGASLAVPHGCSASCMAFDGTYFYILAQAYDLLYIYYPAGDTITSIEVDPSAHGYSFIWFDGNRTLYILPNTNGASAVPFYARMDTITRVVSTDLAVTVRGAGDRCNGFFNIGTDLYRVSTNSGGGNQISLGHCIEGAGPGFGLPFTYQAPITIPGAGVVTGQQPGAIYDPSTYFIGTTGNINKVTMDLSTPAFLVATDTGIATAGVIAPIGMQYNYALIASLFEKDGVTPVPSNFVINTIPSAAGFPSTAIELLANALINTAHMYISAVTGSGFVAPYIQFSISPTGPWVSSLDIGPAIAGQQIPFFVRSFTPSGTIANGNLPFTLQISETP